MARDPRCQSTGHADCYGEIWQCADCGRFFCCNEGADDEHVDLCDECATTPFPHEITLIVEYHVCGARFMPRAKDGGTIVEVREDGVKRSPRNTDFGQAIRWLMDHHYVPTEHRWLQGGGSLLRKKLHSYKRGTQAEAQAVATPLWARGRTEDTHPSSASIVP